MKNLLKRINLKKNKKKIIICGCSLLIVILLLVVGIGVIPKLFDNQEEELTNRLVEIGKDFYEEFYYPQVGENDEEKAKFLANFSEYGIKVSLNNMARVKSGEPDDILAEFKNKRKKQDCDKDASMVVIIPKKPFGKKDYEIKPELVCGFQENEKTVVTGTMHIDAEDKTSEEETTKAAETTKAQ